ncbi:MAG: hypothetical protein RLN81_02245 [Balneolaceae bacterium]
MSLTVIVNCNPKKANEYRNSVVVSDSVYTTDSLSFSSQIKLLIENKESAFYPNSYSLTEDVVIDSIIYSPDRLKAAFFVIVKKPNSSLVASENRSGYHYDAKAFLAQRDEEKAEWNLKWFRIMNINRYSKYDEISNQIRSYYLEDLHKVKNSKGESRYRYNLSDSRFWESPAWSQKSQMLEQNFSGDGG